MCYVKLITSCLEVCISYINTLFPNDVAVDETCFMLADTCIQGWELKITFSERVRLKIFLQKSCFILILLVSDCPKNSQNPNFPPQSLGHVAHLVLWLPFLLFRILFQWSLTTPQTATTWVRILAWAYLKGLSSLT